MTTHLRSTFSSFVRVGLGTLLVLLAGTTTELSARTFHVFCPALSISNILETYAQPGDTIRISGTCKERLTITKDRITLDGLGSGVLDGTGVEPSAPEFNALVTIDGARGLTLRGLTIENSSAEGILAKNGAAFALQDVTVQDNGNTGVAVSANSTAELTDCVMRNNQVMGLRVFSGGTVILKGAIDITDNTEGILVEGQSMLEIRGAQVQVNNSAFFGLTVGQSQVAIFTLSESQGSTLTVNGNGESGILLDSSSLSVFGEPFGSAANVITVSNNGVNGIWLPSLASIISPFATAQFVIENNPTGINFESNSGAIIIGGLTVRNNGTGVLADGAGALTLVSIPPNPSSITDNTDVDVDLRFGSRATFGGPPFVGSVACDGTVLIRGSAGCP